MLSVERLINHPRSEDKDFFFFVKMSPLHFFSLNFGFHFANFCFFCHFFDFFIFFFNSYFSFWIMFRVINFLFFNSTQPLFSRKYFQPSRFDLVNMFNFFSSSLICLLLLITIVSPLFNFLLVGIVFNSFYLFNRNSSQDELLLTYLIW